MLNDAASLVFANCDSAESRYTSQLTTHSLAVAAAGPSIQYRVHPWSLT